jgi:hypothetical protein
MEGFTIYPEVISSEHLTDKEQLHLRNFKLQVATAIEEKDEDAMKQLVIDLIGDKYNIG